MTEFKDALKAVISGHDKEVSYLNNINRLTLDEVNTILRALRIADRLMGEPSREMYLEGRDEMPGTKQFDEVDYHINSFRAMRRQLLKEVNHDQ